jgi:hypothetical protein
LEEKVDMLTCNLSETIHNIWMQQSGNGGICLFNATFDNYVRTFRWSSMYHAFLQGGAFGTNPDELHLCRANQSRDPVQIAIAVAKYISSFGISVKIPHLEGE